MAAPRLDRDAWVAAGLDAFEAGGVEAVAVVPIARALGVTRGSFYWHFASREELLAAVVDRWEQGSSEAVLAQVEAVADPYDRLTMLLGRAAAKPPSIFVRMLDGAATEPLVAAAVARSGERRMAVLARALRELGLTPAEARRRALLIYGSYVGLTRIMQADPELVSERERAAYSRHVAATLIPPRPPAGPAVP
jgi:AcrR family transcriptional regulator